jgi:hypothetical protein
MDSRLRSRPVALIALAAVVSMGLLAALIARTVDHSANEGPSANVGPTSALHLGCDNAVVPSPPATPYVDGGGCLSSASGVPGRPMLVVTNIDGPTVEVIPWKGGTPIVISCGDRDLIPGDPPSQPWDVLVTARASGVVLLQHSEQGPVINIVIRTDSVSVSAEVPGTWPSGPC